jgi:adenylate kinase
LASPSTSNQDTSRERKVILVTGPPLNGRDDYLNTVMVLMRESGYKVGYYHVFEEMKKVALSYGVTLSKANVLDLSRNRLNQIRSAAYQKITDALGHSNNDFDFVSTPGTFRVKPSPNSPYGRIKGLELAHLSAIHPDLIVIFIADLLEVKKNLENDEVWKERVVNNLKNLAE